MYICEKRNLADFNLVGMKAKCQIFLNLKLSLRGRD